MLTLLASAAIISMHIWIKLLLPNLFFGERVVHGYFVLSAAAGLFVDAGVGPVIANYGLENLRFYRTRKTRAIPSGCVSPVSARR